MNRNIKNGIALSIIPQIIVVKTIGHYPEIIEKYYSTGLYPLVSLASRKLLGWVPFSVGDIGYTLCTLLVLRYLVQKRGDILKCPLLFLRNMAIVLSLAYFAFHLLWGFNYYRQPISKTMGLSLETTTADLTFLVSRLVEKNNEIQYQLMADSSEAVQIPYTKNQIFEKTISGYSQLQQQTSFLGYAAPSLKTSLYSTALTYMGYGGYLNPFTNEAQVNGKLPRLRFPVVSAHEIGHQLGYSAENETNFIGYLATETHTDPYFKYAAYNYALSYCLSELRTRNETEFNVQYALLNEGVKKNFREMTEFWQAYDNPLEPVFKSVFNSFLKANSQPAGIRSYNLVVQLLIAYHKNHPL
ncbi:DUF3810 domain-containing protein [Arenibacter sp. GZD96]|uniref:DUF3810 domain-containing protein n=1 Tax=Aurantibrevibacter litoralis TaxID=3106030 RepID=UPI002AFF7113|nr:DUF3810 domain-containing protein [Arenibacter sp. GZD-96]MEA1785091.1 DUF3810 domain-containing protein [Arenibacter sp. GZD-96]